MVCNITQPTIHVYQSRNQDQNITPFLDQHLNSKEEEVEHDLCDYDLGINIEKGLHKVMQSIPLSELVKFPIVKDQVQQFFDKIPIAPKIVYESCHIKSAKGREVEEYPLIYIHTAIYERRSGGHPPFYLTLHINNLLLHNYMLDSGVAMNVMPLGIMKEMGLEITRPYGNVCGIDSRGIQAYGLIKNLKVDLFACPDLNTMMDVVVIDLPPVYDIFLSKKWVVGLGGYLLMDLSYACIPNSNGNLVRIYMEPLY